MEIIRAIKMGNLDTVKFLYSENKRYFSDGYSMMQLATFYNHLHIVKYLFEQGENDTIECLYEAAWRGHVNIFKYLFNSSIIIDIQIMDTITKWVIRGKSEEIMKFINSVTNNMFNTYLGKNVQEMFQKAIDNDDLETVAFVTNSIKNIKIHAEQNNLTPEMTMTLLSNNIWFNFVIDSILIYDSEDLKTIFKNVPMDNVNYNRVQYELGNIYIQEDAYKSIKYFTEAENFDIINRIVNQKMGFGMEEKFKWDEDIGENIKQIISLLKIV